MSEITAVWEKIEQWYAEQGASHLLNPPASEQEITAAETQLGVSFPDEWRESMLRHNGTAEDGWLYGTLLEVKDIVQRERGWRELLEDGSFDSNVDHDASEGEDATQSGLWVAGWIPLDVDGSSNGSVVDMVPGPHGVEGQILDMDHEVGPSGPQHDSLVEYLQAVLDELESGDYVYHDNGIYNALDAQNDAENEEDS